VTLYINLSTHTAVLETTEVLTSMQAAQSAFLSSFCFFFHSYLRQGGYVLPAVCLSVCLSVCPLAGKLKKLLTNFDEFWRGGT